MTKTETEKPVLKFRLKSGIHQSGKNDDLKNYSPGDVVSSSSDLVKLFGSNKFELVQEKGK